MKNIKITLIGAGSAHFSMTFVRDLCKSKLLEGAKLCLMDINPERLSVIENLARRYAAEMHYSLEVTATTSREEALESSDFVVNTALSCNYGRMKQGFELSLKHGFKFPGSYHILYDESFLVNFYQFRMFESIAADMRRLCPDAWHLMVANPVISGVTLLGRKFPDIKTIGICHGYAALYQIAERMGIDRKDITSFAMSGVNHFLWLQDASVNGEPFLPLLKEWLEKHADEIRDDSFVWRTLSAARSDFFFRHGVVPIGDTMHWTGAEWPWWYRSSNDVRELYNEKDPMAGWNYLSEWTWEQTQKFHAWAADKDIRITEAFPPNESDELMVPLIESLALDIPRTFVINVMNKGCAVPGIPEDFQAEAPVLVSGRGLQRIQMPPLPKHVLAHILRDRIAPVEMELSAYNEHRRDFLEELILMDKHAISMKQVRDFLDDIMALPWNEPMREYYL